MSPRRIFQNQTEQERHETACIQLRRALFSGGKAREIAEAKLAKHPGSKIHTTILDLRLKREMLGKDLAELNEACDRFWSDALRPGTSHSQDCILQREVWRQAFHVVHAAESLTQSLLAGGRRFARKTRLRGKIRYEFAIPDFGTRWKSLEQAPISQFNRTLRGTIFHTRLVNPGWVGHINFETRTRRERFLLEKSVLEGSGVRWPPAARKYIEDYSVAADGSRSTQSAIGLDLLDHFRRYTAELDEFINWFLSEMASFNFGRNIGLPEYSLAAYVDLRTEFTPTPSEVQLCEHCGLPHRLAS